MKLVSIGIIIATLALCGCTTSATPALHVRSPWPVSHASVTTVESVALARGIDVIWVNQPMTP